MEVPFSPKLNLWCLANDTDGIFKAHEVFRISVTVAAEPEIIVDALKQIITASHPRLDRFILHLWTPKQPLSAADPNAVTTALQDIHLDPIHPELVADKALFH